MPKKCQIFKCEKCDFICFKNSNYEKHLSTKKHIIANIANIENAENAEKSVKSEKSEKSVKSEKSEKSVKSVKSENTSIKIICPICERSFKHLSSLSRHKKKCKPEENFIIYDNEIKNTNDLNDTQNIEKITNLFMEVVKSNSELQKQTLEMQQQMLEVCKNGNGGVNNSYNNNKTFNMQVFLNEKCKDAMNLTDFVNSMMLQFSDLEELGELGYVEGISRQMVRKLNEMDVYKRPIHCSDLKRETMYVRDDDVWEKETELYDKLRKAIKYITKKNGDLMIPWRDAHPQCMNLQHSLNDTYLGIMNQAMGGKGEFFDSESKIIRKISKSVTIDKKDM